MRHVFVIAVAGRALMVYMHTCDDYTDAQNILVIESRKHSRNRDDSKVLPGYEVVYSSE